MKVGNLEVLLTIALLLSLLICGAIFSMPIITQSTTYVYPDHFPSQTLQEAIWNETVKDGDIIVVRQGTYFVHLNVNKSITIEGFDRYTTILDGSRNGTVIHANAANVNIFEFTIQNGDLHGIYLDSTSNCNVSRNIVKNNVYGIRLSGSSYCMLRNNDIKYNTYNFGVSGFTLVHFIHDVDTSNRVIEKPIYYWVNEHNKPVPTNAGYIALVNCSNITVKGLALVSNSQGILIAYTNHSTIENMNITYNDDGVRLWHSCNNTIRGNTVLQCGMFGVWLTNCSDNAFVGNNIINCKVYYIVTEYSNNNTFYHNNIMDIMNRVWSSDSLNVWDNGAEGNYWKGDSHIDTNRDGICETPHVIDEKNVDRYPLNETWSPIRSLDITLREYLIPFPSWEPLCFITTYSDHVVASIKWYTVSGWITFNITAGSPGFCNVTIPRDRLDCPFDLFVDGNKADPEDRDLNATHCWLYFNYTSGTHNVKIVSYRSNVFFNMDIDGNGLIDMTDIGWVGLYFGKKIWTGKGDIPLVIPPDP